MTLNEWISKLVNKHSLWILSLEIAWPLCSFEATPKRSVQSKDYRIHIIVCFWFYSLLLYLQSLYQFDYLSSILGQVLLFFPHWVYLISQVDFSMLASLCDPICLNHILRIIMFTRSKPSWVQGKSAVLILWSPQLRFLTTSLCQSVLTYLQFISSPHLLPLWSQVIDSSFPHCPPATIYLAISLSLRFFPTVRFYQDRVFNIGQR